MYFGPPLPREQVAVLVKHAPYLGYNAYVASIDTIKTEFRKDTLIELPPGHHSVCARGAFGDYRSEGGCTTLEIDALAGHTYELYAIYLLYNSTVRLEILDVTDDLGHPELRDLAEKVVDIVNANRPNPTTHFPPPSLDPAAAHLAGFGEERTATITGARRSPTTVKYRFDRYRPFLRADGSDGREYYIEISTETGDVVQVFGAVASASDFGPCARGMLQPIGSKYALRLEGDEVKQVCEEVSPGTYVNIVGIGAIKLPAVPAASVQPSVHQISPPGQAVAKQEHVGEASGQNVPGLPAGAPAPALPPTSGNQRVIIQGTLLHYPDRAPMAGKCVSWGAIRDNSFYEPAGTPRAITDSDGFFRLKLDDTVRRGLDPSEKMFALLVYNDRCLDPIGPVGQILNGRELIIQWELPHEPGVLDLDKSGPLLVGDK
jgi:hypothetical protein